MINQASIKSESNVDQLFSETLENVIISSYEKENMNRI